jgi:hypothetical protein
MSDMRRPLDDVATIRDRWSRRGSFRHPRVGESRRCLPHPYRSGRRCLPTIDRPSLAGTGLPFAGFPNPATITVPAIDLPAPRYR